MSLIRRVERELDGRLRKLFSSSGEASHGREPIEIYRGILDEVGSRVQALPKGRRGFPYNYLLIRIPLADEAERPLFEAAFTEGDALRNDILEAIRQQGCEPPENLEVQVTSEVTGEEAPPGGFAIQFQKRQPAVQPVPASAVEATGRLVVLEKGDEPREYVLGTRRSNIGRMADIFDDQNRLVRRNEIVFPAEDKESATVSRVHAHIEFDPAESEFRLFDNRSTHGTTVFRDGRLIRVPAGVGPGIALRPGDEIYFGQARARFEQ